METQNLEKYQYRNIDNTQILKHTKPVSYTYKDIWTHNKYRNIEM